jgi:ArsR family transcriptional regulator
MEELFKAIGDENRLRILNLLTDYELCVCEIEVLLDLNQSNVSRHLGKLKSSGVISSYKDGQWIHYRLSDEFKKNSADLLKYLREQVFNKTIYVRELRKCKIYIDSSLSCQDITSDKDRVQVFLEGELERPIFPEESKNEK